MDMEGATIDEDFLRHLNGSNFDKLTGNVKYFLAPMHTDPFSWSTLCPAGTIKMSFLSPHCELVITNIASVLGIDAIAKSLMWSPKCMIEESMLHASLSADAVIKNCDPGHAQELNMYCKKASPKFVAEIPLYTTIEYVQDTTAIGSVAMKKRFRDNVLYITVPNVNMVVADCFMVDHKRRECSCIRPV